MDFFERLPGGEKPAFGSVQEGTFCPWVGGATDQERSAVSITALLAIVIARIIAAEVGHHLWRAGEAAVDVLGHQRTLPIASRRYSRILGSHRSAVCRSCGCQITSCQKAWSASLPNTSTI